MLIAAVAVFFSTVAATGLVLMLLRRHAIFDRPNERSSHTELTPRGGGIAVIAVLILSWGVLASPEHRLEIFTIIAAVILLACVSWIDDLKSLSPGIRLAAQLIAILPSLLWLNEKYFIFQGIIPEPFNLILAGLIWIWFINLFNFMDGIDGIAGIEAAAIGIGIAIVVTWAAEASIDPRLSVAVAASAFGFLCWNWHPAKLFLGDVGSVPLGFLLGWLLLNLASSSTWPAAVILPLYYFADATITLMRRAIRGEKVWHAHREHFYQRAVQPRMHRLYPRCLHGVDIVPAIALPTRRQRHVLLCCSLLTRSNDPLYGSSSRGVLASQYVSRRVALRVTKRLGRDYQGGYVSSTNFPTPTISSLSPAGHPPIIAVDQLACAIGAPWRASLPLPYFQRPAHGTRA